VRPIAGTWLPAATKQAILIVIATSQDQGVCARRSCAILAIDYGMLARDVSAPPGGECDHHKARRNHPPSRRLGHRRKIEKNAVAA